MAADKDSSRKKYPARHPLMYGFSIFILLVIVVTFVGAPIITGMGGGTRLSFGSFKGKEIAFYPGNYLSRQKDAIAARVAENGNDTNVQWVAYQVWKSAFESTAVHMAILERAERTGLMISEDKIDEALATYGPYVRDGKFDPELYRQVSSKEKMETRNLFRENLIHEQVLKDLQSGQVFSTNEIEFVKGLGRNRKSFTIIAIPPAQFPEERVIEYGKENSSLFRKATFSRITIKSSQEAAQNVLDKLRQAPSTFEETAKAQSKDAYAEKGGLVGSQYFYTFKNEFETESDAETVFALGEEELSEVVETPYGWVIYKNIEPASEPDWTDEETLTVTRSYLERYERGTIEDYLIQFANSVKDEAAAASFSVVASSYELSSFDIEDISVNYGNIEMFPQIPEGENGMLSGAAFNEDFFANLFSLEQDQISDPVLVGENVILAKVINETTADDDELGIIDFYYPYIVQQYQEEELRRSILESDDLVNNFDEVFTRNFLN